MSNYIVLIHQEPGRYGVTVPDFPGCTAQTDSLDEALEEGREAMRLWAEAEARAGRRLPDPRPLGALLSDPDVREDMEGGALLAIAQVLLDEGRTVRLNISLDAGLAEAVDRAAKARGLTRSAFFAQAAREKIEKAGA